MIELPLYVKYIMPQNYILEHLLRDKDEHSVGPYVEDHGINHTSRIVGVFLEV